MQKYLSKKLLHHIKCVTAAFLTALMWRRPLNSVFDHLYPQKIKKLWGGDRNSSAKLDGRQVDGRIE